jgi:DDE superfamily endonuclease
MNILVQLPCIVEHYAPLFEDLFSPEGYIYFKRFISGVLVSDNKTVEGVNRLFVVDPRNQSSFNRFMNRQNFDITALNHRRVGLMQSHETTRFKTAVGHSGVLALDDSIMSHYGRHFDHISNLWDHVAKHYTYAHNLVSLTYSDDKTDYPIAHTLWLPPDWDAVTSKMQELKIHINAERLATRTTEVTKWRTYIKDRYKDYHHKHPELLAVYKPKTYYGLDMLRAFRKQYPDLDLPVAMDGGYTSAAFCKTVDTEFNMAYVGSLASTQHVILAGSESIALSEFIERLKAQQKAKTEKNDKHRFFKTTVHYKGQTIVYYAYCATHRIKGFEKKQRLVIAFKEKDLTDVPYCSISNRMNWHASGILRIRRHRWPIETFHQEGKDEGLDKYQVRNFEAIESHIAFVSVAYTMLKCALHDQELLSKFRQRLPIGSDGTLPLLRRLMQLEGLMALIEFVHLKANQGQPIEDIFRQLIHPVAY